jgi:hypothetical protein
MDATWSGGKLFFSDSPESPNAKGKLYKDTGLAATSGSTYNRVFAYHVNGKASGKARFTVLLKNTSGSTGTLTIQHKGTAGPTTSYAYAGKLAFERWLESTAGSGVQVTAGSWARFDSTYDTTDVSVSYLLHGIWDYSFTQTHEIHICMLDTGDSPTGVCPGLSVLARDTHTRGTFDYADKVYDTSSGEVIDSADGCRSYPIGANTASDLDAQGYDNAVSPATNEELAGNYGVLYRMHLAMVSTDGQNVGLCINPRGGSWGGAIFVMAGLLPTSNTKTLIPTGTGTTGDSAKCAVVGRWSPGAGGINTWWQFMPTGGSSLPVRAIAAPH